MTRKINSGGSRPSARPSATAEGNDRRAAPRLQEERRVGERKGPIARRHSGTGTDSIRPYLDAQIETHRLARPWPRIDDASSSPKKPKS